MTQVYEKDSKAQKVRLTLTGTASMKFEERKYITIIKVMSEKHDLTELIGDNRVVSVVENNSQRSCDLYLGGARIFALAHFEEPNILSWGMAPNVSVTIEFQADGEFLRPGDFTDPANVSEMIGNQ